jgi:hypothetical protein
MAGGPIIGAFAAMKLIVGNSEIVKQRVWHEASGHTDAGAFEFCVQEEEVVALRIAPSNVKKSVKRTGYVVHQATIRSSAREVLQEWAEVQAELRSTVPPQKRSNRG